MARTGYCNFPSGETPTLELVRLGTNVIAQSVVPTELSPDAQGYTWTLDVGLVADVYKINFKVGSYYFGYTFITIGAADGTYYASDTQVDIGNVLNKSATLDLTATTVASVTNAVKIQSGITKNAALANFEFLMISATDHISGKTGLTVTAERSIDGGAFAACANAVSEVSAGVYKISLAAADLNGDIVTLKFTGAGADLRLITIRPTP